MGRRLEGLGVVVDSFEFEVYEPWVERYFSIFLILLGFWRLYSISSPLQDALERHGSSIEHLKFEPASHHESSGTETTHG